MTIEAKERRNANVGKWMAMGMMQRAEQVRDIAEMLNATVEDLSARLEELEGSVEYLQEGIAAIEDRIDEILGLLEEGAGSEMPPFMVRRDAPHTGENSLPFGTC